MNLLCFSAVDEEESFSFFIDGFFLIAVSEDFLLASVGMGDLFQDLRVIVSK